MGIEVSSYALSPNCLLGRSLGGSVWEAWSGIQYPVSRMPLELEQYQSQEQDPIGWHDVLYTIQLVACLSELKMSVIAPPRNWCGAITVILGTILTMSTTHVDSIHLIMYNIYGWIIWWWANKRHSRSFITTKFLILIYSSIRQRN